MSEKTSHQRDVALMLLGAALVKEERERVLGSVPSGSLVREIDALFDAMRSNTYDPLKTWMETRGAVVERGKDAVQALVESVNNERKRQEISRIVIELNHSIKLLNVDQLKMKMAECLERLETLG